MKNLKLIIASLVLIIANSSVFAQEEGEKPLSKKEKIEQLKIAYFTSELTLTTEEAEKFWPIYNEQSTQLLTERKLQRKTGSELKDNFETLSEKEMSAKVKIIFDSEAKSVEIKKEYNLKIAEVIGIKKATKLLSLERKFKKELLKKLKGQHPAPAKP